VRRTPISAYCPQSTPRPPDTVGGRDSELALLMAPLSEYLGQPFIVESRPGPPPCQKLPFSNSTRTKSYFAAGQACAGPLIHIPHTP
jgi:hypothetical protein